MTTSVVKTQLSKPSVGLASLALVLLCALFVLGRPGRLSEHDAYLLQLRHLRLGTVELEKDVLRGRLGLEEKKGSSPEELAVLRAQAEGLRTSPSFLSDADQRRLGATLDNYLRKLSEFEALLAHEREEKSSVQSLLDDSVGLAAETAIQKYLELYQENLAEAERTRVSFFILALLLGLYVVVALVRLGRAGEALNALNAELERRVEERTAALLATNAELRESEARKAAILEGSVDGIITLDEAHRILDFNPAAEHLFRLPLAMALGRDFLSLALAASVTPEQREGVMWALRADAQPGRSARLELTSVRADGDVFPCELTLTRVAAEGPPRFHAYVRDITERTEVERLKSEFVSIVSHELRTPLTSIRGSLGLLEGGVLGELPKPVLDMVRIAHTNTERLIRLINDILDLEKMEAGKVELRLQPVEVAEVVEATLGGLRGMADTAKVALRAEVGGSGLVRADRDRLIQVLTNLVSNAIKFSPSGGAVTVRAFREAQGQVRFEVVDQGPGIPLEKRAKLFGRFQQLDSSDTRSKGGTGLGLAISQAIVEQHGGHIEVRGEPGEGATFTFSLPAVKSDSASLSMVRDESRYNVLVVTAAPELSTLLRGLLTGEGYRVMRATSCAEAEKHLAVGVPDVLVLEAQLPDGEGLALVRKLREEPETREVPVVMLAEHVPLGGAGLPRVDWVKRPLDEARLLQALRQAIREPGPARILVVDDEAEMRRLLRSRLEPLGAECVEAEDGARAVELAREAAPDLIILDVLLPQVDGFEVVDMLRQGKLRGLPLIVFTVKELSPAELRQLTLGTTRLVAKGPGAEEELLEVSRGLLGELLREPEPRRVAS
jgi:PAS domain S-box-containing protein